MSISRILYSSLSTTCFIYKHICPRLTKYSSNILTLSLIQPYRGYIVTSRYVNGHCLAQSSTSLGDLSQTLKLRKDISNADILDSCQTDCVRILLTSNPVFTSFPGLPDTYIYKMAENRYLTGYAKLGTSSCKKCKQKIDKGALRIAKLVSNPFSEVGL
jgi:hypothetical protein